MLDVAALKGVEMLGDTYEITVADLQRRSSGRSSKLLPGDAVIIHTGWGKLYGKDNARFVKSTPGVGVAAAEWLAKQDPLLVGSDNWPVEVAPNPDKDLSLPVHQIFLVVNGIHILENLKLDELAAKRVYEFRVHHAAPQDLRRIGFERRPCGHTLKTPRYASFCGPPMMSPGRNPPRSGATRRALHGSRRIPRWF